MQETPTEPRVGGGQRGRPGGAAGEAGGLGRGRGPGQLPGVQRAGRAGGAKSRSETQLQSMVEPALRRGRDRHAGTGQGGRADRQAVSAQTQPADAGCLPPTSHPGTFCPVRSLSPTSAAILPSGASRSAPAPGTAAPAAARSSRFTSHSPAARTVPAAAPGPRLAPDLSLCLCAAPVSLSRTSPYPPPADPIPLLCLPRARPGG